MPSHRQSQQGQLQTSQGGEGLQVKVMKRERSYSMAFLFLVSAAVNKMLVSSFVLGSSGISAEIAQNTYYAICRSVIFCWQYV